MVGVTVHFFGYSSGNTLLCHVANRGTVTRTSTFEALCPAPAPAADGTATVSQPAVTVMVLRLEQ